MRKKGYTVRKRNTSAPESYFIFTFRSDYSQSKPSPYIRGGLTSAIQSPVRPSATQPARGLQPGATKNHICLDKNRSIPRNQIQRQREIPNKVVQYADHTATEAAAASLLPSNRSVFPTPRCMWSDNASHVPARGTVAVLIARYYYYNYYQLHWDIYDYFSGLMTVEIK